MCSLATALMLSLTGIQSVNAKQAKNKDNGKPNFLWIISEDNSKHFIDLFTPGGAKMPNLENLADNGLIFHNAFSNAPVCSTARTTLATGAYGPKIGTQFHRPLENATLPTDLKSIYQLMYEAGYYVTNNNKSDLNFVEDKIWHENSKTSNWNKRKKGQPFFHIQTFKDTHEHTLHFPDSDFSDKPTKHDPNKVELFPIYPDTPVFRYTHARYLDHHQTIDKKLGQLVEQLAQEGELENTFIFYMGDHGGVLPASKGYVFERGLNTPLVIRIPANYKNLLGQGMQAPQNTPVQGFVSFVDFAPTLLNLAGLPEQPSHDGKAFLGKKVDIVSLNKRNTTFGYGDRFDEKIEMVRTVRVGDFKYIRNFEGFRPDGMNADYRYKQKAYREWRELFKQGKLTDVQKAFFEAKPAERLYNIKTDPHETQNLATRPEYQAITRELSNKLTSELKAWSDLSFYPESVLVTQALKDTASFAKSRKAEINQLIDIANLQLLTFEQAKPKLITALTSNNQWQQMWALIAASSFAEEAKELVTLVEKTAKTSNSIYVKFRAVEFLAIAANKQPDAQFVNLILNAENDYQRLEMLNIAAYLTEYKGFKLAGLEPLKQRLAKEIHKDFYARNLQKYLLSRLEIVSK